MLPREVSAGIRWGWRVRQPHRGKDYGGVGGDANAAVQPPVGAGVRNSAKRDGARLGGPPDPSDNGSSDCGTQDMGVPAGL